MKRATSHEIWDLVYRATRGAVIDSISTGIPEELAELRTLGRTMKRRADDILAYFDHAAPATDPPKPSTAESNTSAAPL